MLALAAVVGFAVLAGAAADRATRGAPGSAPSGSGRPGSAAGASPVEASPVGASVPIRRVSMLAGHPLVAPGFAMPVAECEPPPFARDARSLLAY
ncbi:MAG TPA: hypothetical protein VGD67_19765 [Pseudonocardiaceae bacterium]